MLTPKVKTNKPRELQIQHRCLECELHSLNFFCELSEKDLLAFSALKITRAYPKGTRLFVEGQPSAGVYVLCQGRVKLSTCSPDGKIIILEIVEAGDVLGLSAVISDVEYETTAEVLELCQVNFVPKADFVTFLQQNPLACLSAVRQMGRSYRVAHKMICSLGLSDSVAVKLAKLFLGWSEHSAAHDGAVRMKNTFTHEEIAEMIGTTRETVTRALRDMRERGLVTLKGSDLVIHDAEALRSSTGISVSQL
ncbi:MAG: Crp/Fnr family transcriptional regulator [Pyrinomonadaceae bacterium]